MSVGRLVLSEGYVSANVRDLDNIDADVSGSLAGIELAADELSVRVGAVPSDPHTITVNLNMTPHKMRALAFLLCEKSGLPAFTEKEWQLIAEVLRTFTENGVTSGAEKIRSLAVRIEEAYNL